MKTICIYHANCFDGMAAAWIVRKKYPDAEFIPANYGDKKLETNLLQDCYENANINDRYIIVDFSLPRDLMVLMSNKAKEIIVLDHHATAQGNCEGLDFCKFDMNESGASLAWKHFFPEKREVPHLVRYVRDRDLWKFELPYSKEINAFIQSYPMTLSDYQIVYNVLEDNDGLKFAYIGGRAIERYKQSMVRNICESAKLDPEGIPFVNTSLLFSEVSEYLYQKFGTKWAYYYFDNWAKNLRIYGARSIPEFDVSQIAKANGGGGHKNAAGWQIKLDI